MYLAKVMNRTSFMTMIDSMVQVDYNPRTMSWSFGTLFEILMKYMNGWEDWFDERNVDDGSCRLVSVKMDERIRHLEKFLRALGFVEVN